MRACRIHILAGLLVASLFLLPASCLADSGTTAPLTTAEYRAELDRLLAATQQLDGSGNATPQPLRELPWGWHVRSGQREFDISAEGLQRDIRRYEKGKTVETATAVRTRLQSLRNEIDGFEKPPADASPNRKDLNSILARPEFRNVSGPTWGDRLKQRVLAFVLHALGRLFRSSSFPTIGRFFIYALMGLAILGLGYIAFRSLTYDSSFETVVPEDLPVSAKEWAIWLKEARAAAAKGEWRDAIHLAYWAGISFLERQGTWKPDRARTPREYLRLLSSSSEHRDTLTSLTRIFELTWYAKRGASERTFSETLQELEKLGCR